MVECAPGIEFNIRCQLKSYFPYTYPMLFVQI